MRYVANLTIRPVIELTVRLFSPPEDTKGGVLTRELRATSEMNGYSETPDGWFVPLKAVRPRVAEAADFLSFEATQFGDFELCGGLEFMEGDRHLIPLPLDAAFRDLASIANPILTQEEHAEAQWMCFGNDDCIPLSRVGDMLIFLPDWRSSRLLSEELRFSRSLLIDQTMSAILEVIEFAHAMRTALAELGNPIIRDETVAWMFGLDLLSEHGWA